MCVCEWVGVGVCCVLFSLHNTTSLHHLLSTFKHRGLKNDTSSTTTIIVHVHGRWLGAKLQHAPEPTMHTVRLHDKGLIH